jgi:hypothetical protein
MTTCTYLAKRLRELSSIKTGSYPHEFLCRTNCSACADYQPCLSSPRNSLFIGQQLKFSFLLLEYCKIRECYAVANAFTIRNMYSLFLYMKCISQNQSSKLSNLLMHSQCALSEPISASRNTRKLTVCRFI